MKELFIRHRFNDQSMRLIIHANAILNEYGNQGYTLTLRQLYYQLVARDLLPDEWMDLTTKSKNNLRSYKKLGDLVSNARLAGLIDWSMIEDRGRELSLPATWKNPAEIVKDAAAVFRIDLWEDQPYHVEVMVEKDALSGVLGPICRNLGIGFTANKGYTSSSALYEAGKRLIQAASDDKEICLFYFGDHDPSGIDMTRDIRKRLSLFTRDEFTIDVVRLALNMDQIKHWNPPENPAKETDTRFRAYILEFGDKSWELDAVRPEDLSELVETNVRGLIDTELWEEAENRQEHMKSKLLAFTETYTDS